MGFLTVFQNLHTYLKEKSLVLCQDLQAIIFIDSWQDFPLDGKTFLSSILLSPSHYNKGLPFDS